VLEYVGETSDGRKVVRGMFEMYATYGVAPAVIAFGLEVHKAMIDWVDFYDCAIASGMNPRSVRRLIENIAEATSEEFKVGVMTRLEKVRP